MSYYWIKFKNRKPGTIEAPTKEMALEIAKTFGEPIELDTIPYPAVPALHNPSGCPTFCYTPELCKGHGCCRKARACND